MNQKALGKRINQARKDCNVTAERLAEICNINATYLRQIEGGSKTPSLPVFIDLCNALMVSPTYLLSDMLDTNKIFGFELLTDLLKHATPSQIKMISTMINVAIKE